MHNCDPREGKRRRRKSLRMADQRWEMSIHRCCPQPPPVLSLAATSNNCERLAKHSCCMADNLTRDLLHRLFADGYRADVCVYTNDGIILAHASILVRPLPPSSLSRIEARCSSGWFDVSLWWTGHGFAGDQDHAEAVQEKGRASEGDLHPRCSSQCRPHLSSLPLHIMVTAYTLRLGIAGPVDILCLFW